MSQRIEAWRWQLNEYLERLRGRMVECVEVVQQKLGEPVAVFQQKLVERIAVFQQPLNERVEESAHALYAEFARFSAVCEVLIMRISALDREYSDLRPRVDRLESVVLSSAQC